MKFRYVVLFLSLYIGNTLAQVFPSYSERNYLLERDTSFQTTSTSAFFEGSVDPESYIVGSGDKFFISISGSNEVQYTLTVSLEEILYIPQVGSVVLTNKKLTDAKNLIKSKINQAYKNVNIFISLVDVRRISISLLGFVSNPNTFVLPSTTRLSELLLNTQALTNGSNYRSIKVTHDNKTFETFDFLKYLRFGDKNNNPYLQNGDIIIVDKVDNFVSINGEVKYPGGYEYVEGETIDQLISLAGGISFKGRTDVIEVISFDEAGKSQLSNYYSLDEINKNKIKLKKFDQVLIRQIPDYYNGQYVFIEGFVKSPGYYKIIEDKTTLYDIIQEAGGMKKDASFTEATLIRNKGISTEDKEFDRLKNISHDELTEDEYDYLKAKSRLRTGKVVVDFNKLINNKDFSENVILKQDDYIKIPEKRNYITMLGQVIKPGNIIYNSDYNYKDYITAAGGYGWRAVSNDVRIIKAKSGEWVEADEDVKLEPGDTIWIPEETPGPKFWDVFKDSLAIVGQVASVVAAVVAVIVVSK